MPDIKSVHHETWSVFITREPGDHWPDVPISSRPGAPSFLPDRISVFLERGAQPVVTARGQIRNAGGMPGKRTARREFAPYGAPAPAWVIETARAACDTERLSAEETGSRW